MSRCAAIKPNGERCAAVASGRSDYCYAHSPEHAEARKRAASKAAKARHSSGGTREEIDEIRFFLRAASAELWNPEPGQEEGTGREPRKLSRADASVLAQLCNVRLRLVEIERKLIDQQEPLERIERLEAQTVGHGYPRRSGRFGS